MGIEFNAKIAQNAVWLQCTSSNRKSTDCRASEMKIGSDEINKHSFRSASSETAEEKKKITT